MAGEVDELAVSWLEENGMGGRAAGQSGWALEGAEEAVFLQRSEGSGKGELMNPRWMRKNVEVARNILSAPILLSFLLSIVFFPSLCSFGSNESRSSLDGVGGL